MRDIQEILVTHGVKCVDFGLATPQVYLPDIRIDHFDCDNELHEADAMMSNLNSEQRLAFDTIVEATNDTFNKSKCYFVDGPGWSGKTFLYTTLIRYFRGNGKSVFPAASTEIEANLLSGGRTIHSLYGLPIPLNETSISRIAMNSEAAKQIKDAVLFIIDE